MKVVEDSHNHRALPSKIFFNGWKEDAVVHQK